MKIALFTLFPDLYTPFLQTSLIGRAQERGILATEMINLFSLAAPKERIDAPTVGHGAGMLIRPDIIEKGLQGYVERAGMPFKIFFSPHGKKIDQAYLQELYARIKETGSHIALFPARYEGMDARVEETYADAIISIGDVVLMGGDIPAMMFIEALLRLVPGVIGKEASVAEESFSGPFVDYPEYTTPIEWQGKQVPEVLRSGNHKLIRQWRRNEAAHRTVMHHFDWLRSHVAAQEDMMLAKSFIPNHYAVLMHDQVIVENAEGTTSVTSIDIHDIARSVRTFGLEGFFLVTSLADQQKIVQKLLDFWQRGGGVTYNPHRHDALSRVDVADSLDSVVATIEAKTGKRPLQIITSARQVSSEKNITYYDQEKVWAHDRPVLLIFGTGGGLSDSIVKRADYILAPIKGFSDFNHLSVRSAAAIVFDRWLGIQSKKMYNE